MLNQLAGNQPTGESTETDPSPATSAPVEVHVHDRAGDACQSKLDARFDAVVNPRRIATGDLHLARNQSGDQLLLQRPLDSMAMIECIGQFRSGSKHLVCLLPSAQQGSSARANPVFHRWSWANGRTASSRSRL